MNILLRFSGDHPIDIAADSISGYHRPLSGEVANLTASCQPDAFIDGWLTAPPLGLACAVEVDNVEIMAGILYGVRVTSQAIELQVEG